MTTIEGVRRYKARELEIKGRSLTHAIEKRFGEKVIYSCGVRVMWEWIFGAPGGIAITQDRIFVLKLNPFTGDKILEIPRSCVFDAHVDERKREWVLLRYADGPETRLLKLNVLLRSGQLNTTEVLRSAFAKAESLAETLNAFRGGELTPALAGRARKKRIRAPSKRARATSMAFALIMLFLLLAYSAGGDFHAAARQMLVWVVYVAVVALVFQWLARRVRRHRTRKAHSPDPHGAGERSQLSGQSPRAQAE